MTTSRRKVLGFIFKFLLAVLVIWFLQRKGWLQFKKVEHAIRGEPSWFGLGVLTFGVLILLTAWRWQILVRAQDIPLSYSMAVRLCFVGQFFSVFLPGSTGGDVVKAYYVWHHAEKGTAAVITVFLDRVLGLYCMCAFGTVTTLFFWREMSERQLGWLVVSVAVSFTLMTLGMAVLFAPRVRRFISARPEEGGFPFKATIKKAYEALDLYREAKKSVVAAMLVSFLSVLGGCATFYAYGKAFRDPYMSAQSHLVAYPLGMVANGIPLMPMGIGQGEAAFRSLYEQLTGHPGEDGSTNGGNAMILSRIGTLVWALFGSIFYLTMRADLIREMHASARVEQANGVNTPEESVQ